MRGAGAPGEYGRRQLLYAAAREAEQELLKERQKKGYCGWCLGCRAGEPDSRCE